LLLKTKKNNNPDFGCPNIYIMNLMKSMKSRGYIKETFVWHHFYWYLTNEGIEYLREYLSLPGEIVPDTLKKKQRAEDQFEDNRDNRDNRDHRGGRGYRGGKDSGDFNPQFQNRSYGRGKRYDDQQQTEQPPNNQQTTTTDVVDNW